MRNFALLETLAIVCMAGCSWLSSARAETSADRIVERADAIRNPAESYRMEVEVQNLQAEGAPGADTSLFEVLLNGPDRTLIRQLKPARDRGRNLLMLQQDMWAYIPNLKRAVRVGLSQRLTGQAANGDLSRMRWSGDYDVTIEKQDAKEWVLFLQARKKGLTYDKLRVWIEKGTFHPTRAEYLSVGGKTLKKVAYEGYRALAGSIRPTEIVIQDAVREADRSRIRILGMDVRKFPSSLFKQDNLGQTE